MDSSKQELTSSLADFLGNVSVDWGIVIPALFSVISIFIANHLGANQHLKNHKLMNEEKAYQEYHVPLITWLYRASNEALSYYWLVAVIRCHLKTPDFLYEHIKKNIGYAPKEAASHYNEYMKATAGAQFFYDDQINNSQYEKNALLASEKFDLIIIASLIEASTLAKKLGYPDIAEPLLSSFQNGLNSKNKSDRYIPEIYRVNLK